jgi:hypothetical protein
MNRTRIKITERALLLRINRALKPDGQQLRVARTQQTESSVGRYFIVDLKRSAIKTQHVNLEKFARELGALQPWEELESK